MFTIHDTQCQEFEISAEASFTLRFFKVRHRGIRVGYANCNIHGDEMHLDDIRIEDKALLPANWFVRTFVPLRYREKNYHKRGLGTALLKTVIAYARDNGLRTIKGEITRSDYEQNPTLPDWYCARGFSVDLFPDGSGLVARIAMDLQKPS
jgi:GNAT superfamily N-acetyltransferase